MTQTFSSSAKCLSHYCDVPAVQKLMAMFGNRLERLTQQEKYEICTAIALHLWGQCEPESASSELDIFDELIDVTDFDLITTQDSQLVPEISANAMSALVILQHESPDSLSFLLPAICEYGRDHR